MEGRTPVQMAFSLGWHMAELFHAPAPLSSPTSDAVLDSLPGFGELDDLTRARSTFREIEAETEHVFAATAGVSTPDLGPVRALLAADGREGGELRRAIVPVHVALLTTLTAADFRLGKAYGLGRALAETSIVPVAGNWPTFSEAFERYRVSTISRWLSDLKSQFPSHAAPAVRRSLHDWMAWTERPVMARWSEASGTVVETRPVDWTSSSDLGRVTRAVRRQGEVWRSVLSGEKEPTDLLAADDYVRAGERLFVRLGGLVARYTRRYRDGLLAGLLTVVLVMVVLTVLGMASAVATGLVALAGALGLTWTGVNSTLGTAVDQARRPLWDAEIAAAVAMSATRLPQEIVHDR